MMNLAIPNPFRAPSACIGAQGVALAGALANFATHFVDVGKQWVVDKMDDSSATTMNRVGWGSGAGTTGESNTTLFTEESETRATATLSQQTTTVTGDTFQAVGTITATGTKTITNAGLFDAASGGNMLIKGDFSGIPVLSGDSIEFTFKLHVDQ